MRLKTKLSTIVFILQTLRRNYTVISIIFTPRVYKQRKAKLSTKLFCKNQNHFFLCIHRSSRTNVTTRFVYPVRGVAASGKERDFLKPSLVLPVNFATAVLYEAADAYGCSDYSRYERARHAPTLTT